MKTVLNDVLNDERALDYMCRYVEI